MKIGDDDVYTLRRGKEYAHLFLTAKLGSIWKMKMIITLMYVERIN